MLPGQAEVDQARPAGLVDQDIGRLDVLVDDPAAVGEGDRAGDFGHQGRGLPGATGSSQAYWARVRPRMYSMTRYGRPS